MATFKQERKLKSEQASYLLTTPAYKDALLDAVRIIRTINSLAFSLESLCHFMPEQERLIVKDFAGELKTEAHIVDMQIWQNNPESNGYDG